LFDVRNGRFEWVDGKGARIGFGQEPRHAQTHHKRFTSFLTSINNDTGKFTLRDLYEQFQQIMQLGPLTKIMSMLPGMSDDMFPKDAEADTQKWFRKMLCAMDSMTAEGTPSFTGS
jgi:signal recognition particle GTPase